MKNTFINNEIWLLTFGGGFQRSNAYVKTKNINEKERLAFRNALRHEVERIVKMYYTSKPVSTKAHLEHIDTLIEFTQTYGEAKQGLLNNNQLKYGIIQKIFNLYLKYQWCLEKIKTPPPHFPVDRLIQEKLNKALKQKGLTGFKVKPWTQFETENDYMVVINQANELINYTNDESLAELELRLFGRR